MQKNYGTNRRICSIHTKTTNQKMVPTEPEKQLKNHKNTLLKWLVLLTLLFIALYFYRDSLQEIFEWVKALSALQIGICFLFSLIYFLTEGLIIACMAKPFAPLYRFQNGVRTAYICEFYRLLTLGSGAGLAELYYLQKDHVSYPKGIGISMLQFVIKKIGIMAFGVTGFFYLLNQPNTKAILQDYSSAMTAGCIITIAIVAAMLVVTLSETVKNLLISLLRKAETKFPKYTEKLEKLKENLMLLNDTGKEVITHKFRFFVIILLNLWKLFAIYLIPAYILMGQSSLSLTQSVMLMAVSYMLAGVIPAPSGIGSLEFVFLLFFTRFAKKAAAVPAILVFRLMTWIVPFMIGGVLSAFFDRHKQSDNI